MLQENEKVTLPVEDPTLLEKVILHLVTNLPSPKPDDGDTLVPQGNGGSSSLHLAIIPPRKEKIHEAIAKSYSVIRSCCSTIAGRKRKQNKKTSKPAKVQRHSPVVNGFVDTEVNLPTIPQNYSWAETNTTNSITATLAGSSNAILRSHRSQNLNRSVVPQPSSSHVSLADTQRITALERSNLVVDNEEQSSGFDFYSPSSYQVTTNQPTLEVESRMAHSSTSHLEQSSVTFCSGPHTTNSQSLRHLTVIPNGEVQPEASVINNIPSAATDREVYKDPIPSTSGVKRIYQCEKPSKKVKKMKLKKKIKKHGLSKEIDEMLCHECKYKI